MHTVLLNSQSLTVERPARSLGVAVGAAVTGFSLLLAALLLVRGAGWPVSFPGFLAYTGGVVLLAAGLVFAFWTYACATLRYVLSADAVTVRWGPVAHRIPVANIASVLQGRAGVRPEVKGVGWPGYHIGLGRAGTFPRVLFFSTHRAPEDVVYIETPDVVYALSPQDPARFVAAVERAVEGVEPSESAAPEVRREHLAAHPAWSDRLAQYLALAAVLINAAAWGFIFAVYPDLNNEITIEFPPVGDITTLQDRSEVLKVPATATAILAVNLLVALIFQPRERAATYLVLSGTVFFQVVFIAAAVVAVANA